MVGEHIVAGRGWQGNVVGSVLIAVYSQISVHGSLPTFHNVACFAQLGNLCCHVGK